MLRVPKLSERPASPPAKRSRPSYFVLDRQRRSRLITAGGLPEMTIAEVNLLLSEFQLLLGHLVRHPKPKTSGSQGPTGYGEVPPGIKIELLTTPPEEIAGNAALL